MGFARTANKEQTFGSQNRGSMKVVVLAGGTSTERDVSLVSGSMIYKALKEKGHRAILLDVYLGYTGPVDDIFEKEINWAEKIGNVSEKRTDINEIKAMRGGSDKSFFGPHVLELCQQADVVFMALHGSNGEDGKIQACFELMGIPFTGTDYVSAAMSMDKGITKDIFKAYGIPTPIGILVSEDSIQAKDDPQCGYPCIVKASCGGSSVGVTIARNHDEYEKALAEAFRYDREAVVEQYIQGREFSVGVMDGKALPVIEIAPKQGFYDYKNKYQAGSTIETCPAEISQEKTAEMSQIAERVFAALRLKNYARMDFMMNEREEIFCLEANTLPGMTPTSLLPQEAAVVGIDFDELCEKILMQALNQTRR